MKTCLSDLAILGSTPALAGEFHVGRPNIIDPRRVEEMITPRTTGIVGVHLWGRPQLETGGRQ